MLKSHPWLRFPQLVRPLMAVGVMVLSLALLPPAWAAAQSTLHQDAQRAFWGQLSQLCGQAFAGEMAVYDAIEDADWVGQPMTIHVRECSGDQIQIPLVVGDDRSRTWVVTRLANGLELKHVHRHADGSLDAVSWYGGQTTDDGTASRQAFAVDAYSQSLFFAEGLDVSVSNIWYLAVDSGRLAYGLTRPNRHFRAEFDLTEPVEAPPAPWGHEE